MGNAEISVTSAGKALGRRRPAADEVFGDVDSSRDDLISGKGQKVQIAPSSGALGYNSTLLSKSSFSGAGPTYTISVGDGFSNINGDLVTHVVYSPPDNGLAIGGRNGYIVSVVNDTIGWTPNLTTPMQFKAFSQFFPASLVGNMSFTDPQVLYDSGHKRFIVTEELYKGYSTKSNILVAVSLDSNPNDGWKFFSIDSQYFFNNKGTSADYPQIDTDGVNLYITSDQYAGKDDIYTSHYYGSLVSVIPLDRIENGPAGSIVPSRFVPNTPINETLDVAANPEKGAFFVGYAGYSQDGIEYVTIGYYDNASKQQPTFSKINVGDIDNLGVTTLVATEPNGNLLDANDRRITDVKVIGDHLFAITEVAPNSPNSNPSVHWFDFDIKNPLVPVLKREGDLSGAVIGAGPGVTTFNGSITGDSKYLVLNFTATGPSLNPSDFFAISADGGQTWQIGGPYAASPTSYSDGGKISRWGDYSSAVVDPSHDHAFLLSNEYAVDASHWGTKIVDLSLGGSGTAASRMNTPAGAPNGSGSVDGPTALLTQYLAAGFQGGVGSGAAAYATTSTPENIFDQAPLLTRPMA